MNKNPCVLQDGILFGLPTNNAPTIALIFLFHLHQFHMFKYHIL